jgi:hypothetical protein
METVTVYKDTYDADMDTLFRLQHRHFSLRGNIIALADIMRTNPEFVQEQLDELKKEFQKGVDI